jgi:uncharacterized protein DUF4232
VTVKRVTWATVALCFVASLPITLAATPALASSPSCAHLVVAATSVEGADGVGSVAILLVNVGGRCVVEGYPTVQFFEPRFTHLIGRDLHRATMVYASPPPTRVTLGHGMVASIGVSWSNDPQRHQICSRTQWLNVVLPVKSRLNFQPSLNAVPCGNDVWVTPVELGTQPRIA